MAGFSLGAKKPVELNPFGRSEVQASQQYRQAVAADETQKITHLDGDERQDQFTSVAEDALTCPEGSCDVGTGPEHAEWRQNHNVKIQTQIDADTKSEQE